MKALAILIGVVTLIVISSLWYGYVLSVIWGWFIAPTFSAPLLSVPAAIGMSAAIRFITWQETNGKSEEKSLNEKLAAILVRSFILPALTLFFCWIIKHWM